ncbi:MAG: hypothetical protein ABSD52_13495 [Candidatus Cybelea sp.]|jgi:hypothetical protein
MVRRVFVSVVSSVVALTVAALDPVDRAQAQNAPKQIGIPPSFPEPEPIVLDPATVDRARRLLDAVAHGTFDRSELAPQLGDVSPDFFAKGATYVSALGRPQSMYPYEKRFRAEQTLTYFLVRYPKEILTWIVGVDAANRITLLSLQRSPGYQIFCVAWKDYGY